MLKIFTILLIISIVYITMQICVKVKGGDAIGYTGFQDGNVYFKMGDSNDVLVNTREDLDDMGRGVYGLDGYDSPKTMEEYSIDD